MTKEAMTKEINKYCWSCGKMKSLIDTGHFNTDTGESRRMGVCENERCWINENRIGRFASVWIPVFAVILIVLVFL